MAKRTGASAPETPLTTLAMLRRPREFEIGEREYQHLIDEVCKDDLDVNLRSSGDYRIRLEHVATTAIPRDDAKFLPSGRRLSKHTLRFAVGIRRQAVANIEGGETLAESEIVTVERAVAADELARWFYSLVLAMNIALPGGAGLVGGSIFSPEGLERTIESIDPSEFTAAREVTDRHGWPYVRVLPFTKVWHWMCRLPGFCRDGDMTAAGRAVNALSHVLTSTFSSAEVLMWSMVGIEALYTTGSAGLVQQVRDRARALLGESDRTSKLISSMYDLRSRFVHGDMDFAGAQSMGVQLRYGARDDLRRATEMAVAVLLASVQELIARNWIGIRFGTTCEPS